MSESTDQGQKTQQPTPHRLEKAVSEGDVLVSRELATVLALLAGTLWLVSCGAMMVAAMHRMLSASLQLSPADFVSFAPIETHLPDAAGLLLPLGLLFAATLAVAVAGTAMLGSLGWRGKAMAFKANRINPAAGLKRMFGAQGVIELLKAVGKVAVLGGLSFAVLREDLAGLLSLGAGDLAASAARAGHFMIKLLAVLTGGLVVIALIDIPGQWFQRNRRLMMSFEEVKREARENDGSPEVKGHQRTRQREILSGSARRAVTDATVILTNPTHFAVALRYRPGVDAAPVVVARGRGETALAIRTLAAQSKLPVLEYPQLTRALYYSVRAGRPIPEELFVAVAVILAFVFRLDAALGDAPVPPVVEVPDSHLFDAQGQRLSKHA